MNWSKSPSIIEYVLLFIYLLFYSWYIFRLYRMSRRLGTKARALIIKLIIRSLAFGLMLVAVLGPSFGKTDLETRATAKDIFLIVDLSRSMDTPDVAPSRLERSKLLLTQLVEECKGNRMGLIVFGHDAELRVPLTYDYQAILSQIFQLSTRQIAPSGTNLWAATDLVLAKFQGSSQASQVAQVALILTDGEHFGTPTSPASSALRQAGISFILVGVGTAAGGPVMQNGRPQRTDQGQELISKREDNFLKRNAAFLRASLHWLDPNSNDPLYAILDQVQQIQLPTADLRKILLANDKYYYFLALALVFIMLDILITLPILKI